MGNYGNGLAGILVKAFSRQSELAYHPVLVVGTDSNGNVVPLTLASDGTPTGAARTPSITTITTGTSTIASGARGLTLIFSSDFAGTVLGATFSGASDSSVTIPVPAGDTVTAINYSVTAGSMRAVKVV